MTRLDMRMVEQAITNMKVISQKCREDWCHMSSLSEVGRRVRRSLVSRLTPAHTTTSRQQTRRRMAVVMRW